MRQNIGIGTFARQYGGRNKRKGTVPEHFARASRGLIRHILKQVSTCTCWQGMPTVTHCPENDRGASQSDMRSAANLAPPIQPKLAARPLQHLLDGCPTTLIGYVAVCV